MSALDVAVDTIRGAQGDLTEIETAVAELLERRARLLQSTRDELETLGFDTIVRDMRDERIPRGALVAAEEVHMSNWDGSIREDLIINSKSQARTIVADGIYLRASWIEDHAPHLRIPRGLWRCLINDDGVHLFARVSDEDLGHRGSIPKLRKWARKSDMRVRIRGTHAQLIDPMGYVAHNGTIASAFRWIAGYNPEPLEDK